MTVFEKIKEMTAEDIAGMIDREEWNAWMHQQCEACKLGDLCEEAGACIVTKTNRAALIMWLNSEYRDDERRTEASAD